MSVILLIARLSLAAVFGVAGIAKLADPAASRRSMEDFGVPKTLAPLLGLLLPLSELICAASLIPVASAWWGAIGTLALLLIFIAAMSVSLVRGLKPDCHCFGQLHSSPIGWDLVLRNSILAMIAGVIVWQGSRDAGASVVGFWASLTRSETALLILAMAIGGLAILQLWALVHVLRQNGRMLLRIEALENRPGGAVEAPRPGLPVDSVAPEFRLQDLEGETVTLDTLRVPGRPVLLLFSEPGCAACDAALPEISQWQREYEDRVGIVVITSGRADENREKVQKIGLKNVLLQSSREVADKFQATAVPSAVLISDGLIASHLAMGVDDIRGLVARAVLPPSVGKGQPVPSLRLADLSGSMMDLASLKRRTLVLFWNPDCGYCQRMLEELKVWERNRSDEAPELLVISTGSLDSNRQQGFLAKVLLDPYSAASQVFNSGGTPSAVVIDEARVASDVAVGGPDVLALAQAVPLTARHDY